MGKKVKGDEESKAAQLVLFDADVETFVKGKDELNLVEFPIAVVADSAKAGQLSLVFSDAITDSATGGTIDRSVTVSATEEWGLPAAQDDEVMIGLLQICHLAGGRMSWPKHFCFTRYQLCKLLHWSMGGASYRRIYTALHRISTTSYNYRYSWRDRTSKEWIPSQVFSYIQALKVHEADRPTDSGLCEVTWSDAFHKSLEAGNLKGINFGLFVSLKRSISKRLYRFLDKRFGAGWAVVTYDLKTLAFEKIGISRRYTDSSQIKRLLTPAIRELEEKRFIEPAAPEERFEKVARGVWKVRFRRYSRKESSGPKRESKSSHSEIERRLVASGVFPSEAKKFVKEYPADYLERKLDEFQFRTVKKNEGGLLADSIRRNLPAPDNYRSPSQRAEDAAEKKNRAKARAKVEQEQKRREKAAQEVEDKEREVAMKRLAKLTVPEREKLEAIARTRFPGASSETIHWTMVGLIREMMHRESSEANLQRRKNVV